MKRDDEKPSRLRRLSAEEIDLWLAVTANVTRNPGATLPETLARPKAVKPKPAKPDATKIEGLSGSRTSQQKSKTGPPTPSGLERPLRQKLARGRLGVDAAIDLHGLRQAEAHSALRHFLHQAQRDGARIVLIVTGKGGRHANPFDPYDGSVGILRRSVPHWLTQPDLRAMVIGFEEAGRFHGGAGALYARLRRRD